MSFWIIFSWICVALLTGVNIFLFLKLKQASEQMMKMAFPGTNNLGDALGKMQQLFQGMPGGAAGFPDLNQLLSQQGGKDSMKAAMTLFQEMQKNSKKSGSFKK